MIATVSLVRQETIAEIRQTFSKNPPDQSQVPHNYTSNVNNGLIGSDRSSFVRCLNRVVCAFVFAEFARNSVAAQSNNRFLSMEFKRAADCPNRRVNGEKLKYFKGKLPL